ncbi:hypothetical protein LTR35_002791 [Friedmanniomyces endolithicus]|uniref:Uncharacterized protein n=1 Tax=Friedmanniomyces endolithicus TaxID=329885 RepID=A0AAN6G2J0_9PEZI|nr:hypothetical protein LTS00_010056 [Friedmanniomyces endolithicus]KAK0289593.1 hypothetical protein LTR35_002791 [Friedmanniomyces endolithicus]KAK0328633.1 hypothetical protein LTR82_000564 [Friedmanniomyces endolithicus]KAK1019672.1 hypothetical protein LTR54_000315 [Friedmanniomyces endolithicus]
MGDLLHDMIFVHLKGEREHAAKSGEDANATNQQTAGKTYETEPGGTPDHPGQAGLMEDVNQTDPKVRVERERTAGVVKAGASKGTECDTDKEADADDETEVDRRRSGWLEAAQSMCAPWYPYT